MNHKELKAALDSAVSAARAAGKLMRDNLRSVKKINARTRHDIKLELDVRCQKLIERLLAKNFPKVAVLGEEEITGDPNAAARWVVDPIDGTVNFAYQIPHACVSIALQTRIASPDNRGAGSELYETVVGVVYDPFCDELWTAIRGQPAHLNGQVIRVSNRNLLREAIVAIGFAKTKSNLARVLPYFNRLVSQTRKVRIMGSAALALTYVASGRFDAYVEKGIRIWDIAAGGLIVECAGGEFWRKKIPGKYKYRMIAGNGLLRKKLESIEGFE
jgi:myo-inositol-1(or 4)-monophosphatase